MKLLRISSLSSTGRQIIEAAGTDIWKAIKTQEVTWRNGRECLLIEPFSDHPDDATHITRHSHWMLNRMDRDLKIEEEISLD